MVRPAHYRSFRFILILTLGHGERLIRIDGSVQSMPWAVPHEWTGPVALQVPGCAALPPRWSKVTGRGVHCPQPGGNFRYPRRVGSWAYQGGLNVSVC